MRFELWQIILMLCKEFVRHLANFCEGASNCHLFNAARKIREQGTFSGERANVNGMEASLVNDDWHFHTCALRKIGDEIRVTNVAVELEHLAASEGIDDVRGVLMFALQVFGRERLSKPLFDLVLPCGVPVLIFLEDVGVLAGIPARAMRAIFFDEVGALAEPRIVFRVVPARLGDHE